VKENDDRQYEQKWHDVADQTASECAQIPHSSIPVTPFRPDQGTPPANLP
jgi:hypothetical protein